jgi:uncharacterized membrane protein YgcG
VNRDFEALLEEAISRLERGGTVEDCLARYPEYAGRLEPLLRMAAFSMRTLAYTEMASEAALVAGKQRFLVAAQGKPAPQTRRSLSLFPLQMRGLVTAALVVLILVVVGGGLVVASAGSLPGDLLYPVKLATEQARLLLTFDVHARDQLLAEFAQERRAEVAAVLEAGRKVCVRFEGTLEDLDDVVWIIDGLEVTLDANTLIEGNPMVGATVDVEGMTLGDGSLLATRLTVKGTGEMIRPTFAPSPTMTLQPTVVPTMTPHPRATYTPYPTETREPEPTYTPQPTETYEPEPTHTPQPIETHEPEPTHTPQTAEDHDSGHDDGDHDSGDHGGGDHDDGDHGGGDHSGGGNKGGH